jgi:multiple sugar transport system ATP-binding protein
MATIALDAVRKVYPNGHIAVRDLGLTIDDGELMVLVGPSGCGKSTVLRMIAGLESPTEGRILIGGRDVTGLEPQDRDVAMVFQSYALYPHMTVRDNLAFGIRMRGASSALVAERVASVSAMLGLEQVLDRKPGQLSGGQRQRVALGRAIAREPQAFLFDEPLSNLDARLRVETRAELVRLHRRLGTTSVYVTHDQEEAMTLGQRLAVMREGRIDQVDTPMAVYRRPATMFVAAFVGSPEINLLPGQSIPGLRPPSPDAILGVRPHDVAIVGAEAADLPARVDIVEHRGSELLILLRLESGTELRVVAPPDALLPADAAVGIRLDREQLHWFERESGRRMEGGTSASAGAGARDQHQH